MHNFSRRKVKPQIAKLACQLGIKHSFNKDIIFEPLYEILIECMSNTNNHAGKGVRASYSWWLYVYKNPVGNVTHYSFIDLGVGIYESLPVKGYINKALMSLGVISNTSILPKIFNGEIKSRTADPLRGKGLPQIYSHSKHKNIQNFKIISNDVYADLTTEKYIKLDYNFHGTFLYWELHP